MGLPARRAPRRRTCRPRRRRPGRPRPPGSGTRLIRGAAGGRGVRAARRKARRAAYLAAPQAGPDAPPSSLMNAMSEPGSITMMAFCNPAEQLTPGLPNTARWRAAEIPASNGHATARALATLYGRLVSGAIVGPDVLGRAVAPRSEGRDEVPRGQTRFALGYMPPCEIRPFAPNPRAFGHSGSGGALAFADPDAGVALAYTPSRLVVSAAGPDPRWQPMVAALYACL
ncbi:serine hydrolase domain-containing protein [Microbispora bryophytorum]|uniref:serine hydrolase domain-containing protein n=1 Tax=Microbispora bryophytorum TaxID=1460882 RepID=UPI0033EC0803